MTENVLKEISNEDLEIILNKHKQWLAVANTGKRAVLKGYNLSDLELLGKDLRFVDFSGSNLSRTTFKGSDLRGITLIGVNLQDADLKGVDLSFANMSDSNLKGVCLQKSNLNDAIFRNSDLSYSYLNNATMESAELINANLEYAILKGCNLKRAFLCEANLTDANLNGSDLTHAYLSKLVLSNTDLKYVKISEQLDANVITLQINTSRQNAAITYWVDYDIATTGCFQGTLSELKERVEVQHKEDLVILERYRKTINYLEFLSSSYKLES